MQKTFLLSLFVLFMLSTNAQIQTGAEQMNQWLPFTRNKSIALVVNQTSRVGARHIVDTLLSLKVKVERIFAPEHGFRGDHGAGEKVHSGRDVKTGLSIISLYGRHKKPTVSDMQGIGLVIFDIQDVGARFYTYISTMHYVMEACAEQGIPFLVLDRPNPNGHYVDGPVLDTAFRSFVGMHPVPVVHGMTIGEYARMINGEGWLEGGIQCELAVIPVKGYTHHTAYSLPVAPSPNLPNDLSIAWYPSLCFFEGTDVSVGRGTTMPFQVFGKPEFKEVPGFRDTSFTPMPDPHAAPNPKWKGRECFGLYLGKDSVLNQLHLDYLIRAYQKSQDPSKFFNAFFMKLAGTDALQRMIEEGRSMEDIRSSWATGLKTFKVIRNKYLLYPD